MSWKRNFTKEETSLVDQFVAGKLNGVTTVEQLAELLDRKVDTVNRRVAIAKAIRETRGE